MILSFMVGRGEEVRILHFTDISSILDIVDANTNVGNFFVRQFSSNNFAFFEQQFCLPQKVRPLAPRTRGRRPGAGPAFSARDDGRAATARAAAAGAGDRHRRGL